MTADDEVKLRREVQRIIFNVPVIDQRDEVVALVLKYAATPESDHTTPPYSEH